jgi:hypothetical protein
LPPGEATAEKKYMVMRFGGRAGGNPVLAAPASFSPGTANEYGAAPERHPE